MGVKPTNRPRFWQVTSTPVLLTAVVLTAIFLTWATLATTPPIKIGVDLAAYQRAGDDLYSTGNPYTSNALSAQESQYRYPPLLAFVIPVLGWGPLWMLLMLTGMVMPFVLGWRQGGWRGRLLPLAVIGPSLHGVIVGNIQPLANGAWASVPFYRRLGPVILAFLFWVKVWPAISVLYYIGRGDRRSLSIFLISAVAIGILQVPWLDDWVRYWLSEYALLLSQGIALPVLIGDVGWLVVAGVAVLASLVWARTHWGWRLTILAYFAANPRLFVPSLSSVSSAVFAERRSDQSHDDSVRNGT